MNKDEIFKPLILHCLNSENPVSYSKKHLFYELNSKEVPNIKKVMIELCSTTTKKKKRIATFFGFDKFISCNVEYKYLYVSITTSDVKEVISHPISYVTINGFTETEYAKVTYPDIFIKYVEDEFIELFIKKVTEISTIKELEKLNNYKQMVTNTIKGV